MRSTQKILKKDFFDKLKALPEVFIPAGLLSYSVSVTVSTAFPPPLFSSSREISQITTNPAASMSGQESQPHPDGIPGKISATDARTLGVSAPIRLSGDVKGSAPIKIVNPENGRELDLAEGVIVAKRHIHMTPEDAEAFGVKDGDSVYVAVSTPERETIFGDTIIRVSPKFSLAMHIDTDESNAANASGEVYGQILMYEDCECEGHEEGGCCHGEGHCCHHDKQ